MNQGVILTFTLLIYFSFGAGLIHINNKNKDRQAIHNSWLKYIVYLGIVFLLFITIFYFHYWYRFISLFVVLAGAVEISRLESKSLHMNRVFYINTLLLYIFLSWLFYSFSVLEKPLLLITFFTVSSFDAFSQTIGQILGKNKITPQVSPNKTIEGFLGGLIFSLLTALFVGNILDMQLGISLFWGVCISISAFIGDLAASAVKRKYKVKDFNQLIPGHGGFLDRFDSLIFAGAMVFLINRLI